MFVPNFKILSQVVSERSLTEFFFTDRQMHKHPYGKGKNYIPPIYFVYRGYNYNGQESTMLHTKFPANQPAGSGENFEGFLPQMGVAAVLVM